MTKTSYDVAIAYRIYPKVSKIPPIHSDNKYKLSELCLASFVRSLGDISARWFVILDDCPPEYKLMFRKYIQDEHAEYIETSVRSNGATFGMQLDILRNQNYSEKIYFAEDDYFYLPKVFHELLDAIEDENIDFLSPYDHLDLYTREFHRIKCSVIFSGKRHWRSAASTTMTFLTTKSKISGAAGVFKTYISKNYDSSLWMALTKNNVNSPVRFVRLLRNERETLKIFAKAWLFCHLQILFGRRYSLYSPAPSIALHMDNRCMAPGIDWQRQFGEAEKWLIR